MVDLSTRIEYVRLIWRENRVIHRVWKWRKRMEAECLLGEEDSIDAALMEHLVSWTSDMHRELLMRW